MERLNTSQKTAGIALILVLGMLVLLSAIVVAFLTSVTTDLSASKSYEYQTGTRELADSAVNLAIAQIRQASTIPKVAWISQPGLIRTFDDSGKALNAYKLYSDDTLQVSGEFDPADIQIDPSWRSQPNLYTDLNSPVLTDSIANFPIIDGNAMVAGSDGGLTYDANGDSKPDVEGFSVDSKAIGFVRGKNVSPSNNPVAMPVKWLYLLKDGGLLPARGGEDGKFDVQIGNGSVKPTLANPIVARVAFWTDDETSKVNINTASEGTFWDSPIAISYPPSGKPTQIDANFDSSKLYESDLAFRSGAQQEYQRYPGHPATTSLSPILDGALSDALGITVGSPLGLDRARLTKAITDMVPRVTDDLKYSSRAGTTRATESATGVFEAANKIPVDADRLFATPDELLFSSKFLNSRRVIQENGDEKLLTDIELRKLVNRTRFFLTATSRAPEVNLFNKPRVAVWPINADPNKRTSFDKLFAFCSVVGNYDVSDSVTASTKTGAPVYFFSRSNPTSATADLTPNTGQSRNYQIYEYLQSLTGAKVPGFGGGTFATKYGIDRDQILTEIFDYIRCTNLIDVSEAKNATDLANTAFSMAPGATVADLYSNYTRRGQVVPISLPGNLTKGFGRMATISEMGLVIIKTSSTAGKPYGGYDPTKESALEMILVPELFCPAVGFSVLADDINLKFTNLNFTITDPGTPGLLFSPFSSKPSHEMYLPGRVASGRASRTGGFMGVGTMFAIGSVDNPTPSLPPNAHFKFPQISGRPITIEGSCDVTVSCYSSRTAEPTLQTFKFKFPSFTSTVPEFQGMGSSNPIDFTKPDDGSAAAYPSTGYTKTKGYRLVAGGAAQAAKNYVNTINNPTAGETGRTVAAFSEKDIIRSVIPTGQGIQGDMRLIAGLKDVPSEFFVPGPRYSNNVLQAHSLRKTYFASGAGGGNVMLNGGKNGYLFKNLVEPAEDFSGDIPEGIEAVTNSIGGSGDWDNGLALMQDGPFINKADEGIKGFTNKYIPYISDFFDTDQTEVASGTFFSPNRLMPSPAMFGSLSTGVKRHFPWQTLLFRPAASYLPGGTNHPGSVSPPDHLLLDLFWMPVVEPYAISEPFATAGKINLNYQIAPFNYIKRDTGMRAALQSSMLTALNPNAVSSTGGTFIIGSKNPTDTTGSNVGVITRYKVDSEQTMRNVEDTHFKKGVNKPFISESEICNVPLIPIGSSASSLTGFWNRNNMTGDNSLERPYALLYPRLTTKSNSYTVHVRVQSLKKASADKDQDVFKDGRDQVTGEFRGSFVIERYLDPNTAGFYPNGDPTQPKAVENDSTAVLGPYKFRVVSSKQFGQ